jgi:hypothetical protein
MLDALNAADEIPVGPTTLLSTDESLRFEYLPDPAQNQSDDELIEALGAVLRELDLVEPLPPHESLGLAPGPLGETESR